MGEKGSNGDLALRRGRSASTTGSPEPGTRALAIPGGGSAACDLMTPGPTCWRASNLSHPSRKTISTAIKVTGLNSVALMKPEPLRAGFPSMRKFGNPICCAVLPICPMGTAAKFADPARIGVGHRNRGVGIAVLCECVVKRSAQQRPSDPYHEMPTRNATSSTRPLGL